MYVNLYVTMVDVDHEAVCSAAVVLNVLYTVDIFDIDTDNKRPSGDTQEQLSSPRYKYSAFFSAGTHLNYVRQCATEIRTGKHRTCLLFAI